MAEDMRILVKKGELGKGTPFHLILPSSSRGFLKYHPKSSKSKVLSKEGNVCRNSPLVTHPFFIDGSQLFTQANDKEAWELARLTKIHCLALGQKINFKK